MLAAALISLVVGQVGVAPSIEPFIPYVRQQGGGSSELLRVDWSGSSEYPPYPLLEETAATVSHVTWNGTALVDSKGLSWTQNGTVSQVSDTGLFSSGFSGAARGGAGPFASGVYYLLGTGSPLEFTGDFTIYVVVRPSAGDMAAGHVVLGDYASAAYPGYAIQSSINTMRGCTSTASTAICQSNGVATANGITIVTLGRAGATSYLKTNLATTTSWASANYVPNTAAGISIGGDLAGGSSFTGEIYEILASTDAWDEARVTAIQRRFFNLLGTRGEPVTFARASSPLCCPKVGARCFYVPAGTPCVTQDGAEIYGAGTEKLLQTETLATGTGATAPWALFNAGGPAPVTLNDDADGVADQADFPAINGASQQSILYQTFTGTVAPWTLACWFKAASAPGTVYMTFQSNSAFVGATPCSVTTGGYTRCSLTATLSATGNSYAILGPHAASGLQPTTQPALSVLVRGCNLWASPAPYPYLPATAAAVAFAANVVTVPLAAGITPQRGSVEACFSAPGVANARVVADGTSAVDLPIYFGDVLQLYVRAGAIYAGPLAYSAGASVCVDTGWGSGTVKIMTPTTSATGVYADSCATGSVFRLGTAIGDGNPLNGTIKSFRQCAGSKGCRP